MKTKDLIRLLLENDETGECEVCVDNIDIIDVSSPMPTYYDGQFCQIVCTDVAREVNTNNCYGVAKVIARTRGNKIKLRTMDPEEAFLNNPDAEFEMDPYNPEREKNWLLSVEKWREYGRKFYEDLKREISKIP